MSIPTFFEPALCTQQTHSQLELEPPQSNKAPSTLEWPVTQRSRHMRVRTKAWRHNITEPCTANRGFMVRADKEPKLWWRNVIALQLKEGTSAKSQAVITVMQRSGRWGWKGSLEDLMKMRGTVWEADDLTMRKAEYTTLLAVGMTWPPPLWRGSWAMTASRILNLTFLMAEGSGQTELLWCNTGKQKHIFPGHNVTTHNTKYSCEAEIPVKIERGSTVLSVKPTRFYWLNKEKRTHAHHTEAPLWCPTESPERCCLWLSRAALCPPTEREKKTSGIRHV